MAAYHIMQNDIHLLHYSKIIHVKVFLLNENNLIIDELQGYVTDGNGSDDANSDIRKTCSFTLHSYDASYNLGEYHRIWLNNRVRIDLGFEYFGEIYWYTKGTYLFTSCSYAYHGSARELTFQCADLVSSIDGTHGGTLLGESFSIQGCTYNEETGLWEGHDIKKCVEDLLTQHGITEFRVDTIGQISCLQNYNSNWIENRVETGTSKTCADTDALNGFDSLNNDTGTWHMIPYDLEFDKGITLWEILKKIRDLYPGYEMFFDKDGTFVFQLIPICHRDGNVLDHTQFEGLVIAENADADLTGIKNATKIYGESIEIDRYSDTCSSASVSYQNKTVLAVKPTFDSSFTYSSNMVIGILFPKFSQENLTQEAYLSINDISYPITTKIPVINTDKDGGAGYSIEYKTMIYDDLYNHSANVDYQDMYCFKFLASKEVWVYTGMYQIEGYAENNDENSPFSIDKIGYRLQVLSGGEYQNITSSVLAQERAEYENWLASRLTDSLTLETVIIPFLEVNQKIQYQKLSDGSIDSYIIKSLSYSFAEGTMTITMIKFYEMDPFIVRS